jgi:hypothetical protein
MGGRTHEKETAMPWIEALEGPNAQDPYTHSRDSHRLLHAAVASATCMVCGRRPHPARLRLTLAKLLAVLPVELLLHAVVVHYHLPYWAKVCVLALTTTLLVIWVVEPATARLLRSWLHAPGERLQRELNTNLMLWRIRVTVDDEPGSLERLTHQLTSLDANILSLQVHPLEEGALDELVVAAGSHLDRDDLLEALAAAGGRDPRVQITSALALVDAETRALELADRVTADPAELPRAVATLLNAGLVTDRKRLDDSRPSSMGPGATTLRIPSPWTAGLVFERPGQPFTPAESARAHGLARLAQAAHTRTTAH